MTTKQIPIWIDCDTGTDDTVAIMLAHALPLISRGTPISAGITVRFCQGAVRACRRSKAQV